MDIQEATTKAVNDNKYISRRAKGWYDDNKNVLIKIKPTNGNGGCILILMRLGKIESSCRGWQPSAEDFMANDWIVSD